MESTEPKQCHYITGYGALRQILQSVLNGTTQLQNVRGDDVSTFDIPDFHARVTWDKAVDKRPWNHVTQVVYRTMFARVSISLSYFRDDDPSVSMWDTCESVGSDLRHTFDEWLHQVSQSERNRVFVLRKSADLGNNQLLAIVGISGRPTLCFTCHWQTTLRESGPGIGRMRYLNVRARISEVYVAMTNFSPLMSVTSHSASDEFDMDTAKAMAHLVLGASLSLCIPQIWTECNGFGKRLAFAMGLHARLGKGSRIFALDPFLVAFILKLVRNEDGRVCGMTDVAHGIFHSESVKQPFLFDADSNTVYSFERLGL